MSIKTPAPTATDRLLTSTEAAEWLGIPAKSLAQLRYMGTGPAFAVVGTRLIRYRMVDLVAYVEANLRTETGAPA